MFPSGDSLQDKRALLPKAGKSSVKDGMSPAQIPALASEPSNPLPNTLLTKYLLRDHFPSGILGQGTSIKESSSVVLIDLPQGHLRKDLLKRKHPMVFLQIAEMG